MHGWSGNVSHAPSTPTLFRVAVPYLCGIVRENWLRAQSYVSGDTIVVDLDRNSVVFGDMVLSTPPLPAKKFQKLRSCLVDTVGHVFWRARGLEGEYRHEQTKKASKRNLDGLKQNSREWMEKLNGLDHAFNLAYTPDSPNLLSDTLPDDERQKWDRVQSGFLRFFTALFKGYRKYLQQAGPNRFSFDRVGFLASQKSERSDFLVELTATQQFDDFMTRRMYSPGEPDLIFFDQSVNAKLNRSKLKIRKEPTPFLQAAKAHKELKKVSAVEVNVEGLDKSRYVYQKWPDEFNPKLFSQPRPVPKMISAEFDRQSALVAKLRAFDMDNGDDNDDILEFYGGDYDESPEVAAFTVFFFVYSSLVGRDWQEYQRRRAEHVRSAAPLRSMSVPCGDNNITRGVGSGCGVGGTTEGDEAVEVIELSESEHVALNGCVDDLSMGLCDACPEDSVLALKSAILYCGDGAQDMYTKLFERTAEHVAELQLQLNAAAMMKHRAAADEPTIDDDGADDALIEYEEAKEVANAQLDLAFEVLKTMSLRGLSTDSDAYLSLMEACGRCGDTQRALHLIELMRNDGFVADGEVLGCFVAAFAHEEGVADDGSVEMAMGNTEIMESANGDNATNALRSPTSDAYSTYLQKKLEAAANSRAGGPFASLSALSDCRPVSYRSAVTAGGAEDHTEDAAFSETSSAASGSSSQHQHQHHQHDWVDKPPTGGRAFLDWMSSHHHEGLNGTATGDGGIGAANGHRRKHRKRWRRRSTLAQSATSSQHHPLPVTDFVSHQLELGDAMLEFLYPDLTLDSTDCCPHCSHELTEADVVKGWLPCNFQDCTSACPKCTFRFVPRFSVSSRSPTFSGSQGPQTPLYCEFLSPWVIRKELQHVLKGGGEGGNNTVGGIRQMLKPAWRDGSGIEATLFWNVLLLCRRYRLPYSFLLQGSFRQSRLVLPRIPGDMI
jgi:pentatricopeptide repeat protein